MVETLENMSEEINNIASSYKRTLALEIIEELEKRQISPFDFLNKMLNYTEGEIVPINPLSECECLENHEA